MNCIVKENKNDRFSNMAKLDDDKLYTSIIHDFMDEMKKVTVIINDVTIHAHGGKVRFMENDFNKEANKSIHGLLFNKSNSLKFCKFIINTLQSLLDIILGEVIHKKYPILVRNIGYDCNNDIEDIILILAHIIRKYLISEMGFYSYMVVIKPFRNINIINHTTIDPVGVITPCYILEIDENNVTKSIIKYLGDNGRKVYTYAELYEIWQIEIIQNMYGEDIYRGIGKTILEYVN
jgi:hypothetical protein